MRKKWLYFFIGFVIVIYVLYVWRYKQSQVFENRVPADATKVVNVNLRQIENHLLFDFLSNPITYLKPRKRKDSIKKPRFSLFKGLSVPRNVFFYTNSINLKNNWFSSVIDVNDKEEFSEYLLKEKFVKKSKEKTVYYSKANFVLAIKESQLIVILKTNGKADVNSDVNPLFEVKDFLDKDAKLFKPLVNSKSDISFSFGNDILEADFKDGVFELQGNLTSDLFIATTNQKPDENSVVAIAGQLNKNNTLFKEFLIDKKDKFNEFTHLSIDSIVNKWNGKLEMNIASIERTTDTIVSYEYDDDFNKIEIKSTQEKSVPSLGLILGQEKISGLSDYFYNENAIQMVDNEPVFTTIPVFKFLATSTKENLELQVNRNKTPMNLATVSSKFNFYFNTEKYTENPLDIPLNKDQDKFLKLTKSIKLDWNADNQFVLKIKIKDTNRNFLGKLIKQ